MRKTRGRIRSAVIGVAAGALTVAGIGVTTVVGAGAADSAVGCGTDDRTVVLDAWALYGKQAPLLGESSWGETIRTHTLPSPLAPGQYRIYGVSEDNFSPEGQLHEQWAVEIGGSRSEFTPDIPDDAVWFAQTPGPDDDGDLATTPAWVESQLPGYDLGVVDVGTPQTSFSVVHIEHDGQLEPWSPNSVNYRFITFSCVTPSPTTTPTTQPATTQPPTTQPPTTAAPTTEAPTTAPPTTEAPTTAAPTTEAPTTQPEATESTPPPTGESEVAAEVVTNEENPGLAFTGTDVATLSTLGLMMIGLGGALLRLRRRNQPTG